MSFLSIYGHIGGYDGFADGVGHGTDYFLLREPFTPQQESYLTRTREFVDTEVLPVINDYWERAEFPWALIKKMAPLGIVGDGIEGYGCPEAAQNGTSLHRAGCVLAPGGTTCRSPLNLYLASR
jgi:Acyl-CoA dehydrogenase, N-terminal domain